MEMWRIFIVLSLCCYLCFGEDSSDQENFCLTKTVLRKYTDIDESAIRVNNIVKIIGDVQRGNVAEKRFNIQNGAVGSCNNFTNVQQLLDQCRAGSEVLEARGYSNSDRLLNISEVNNLSPMLLYLLTTEKCKERDKNITLLTDHHDDSQTKAWLGSVGSVIVISLVGFAVIAVIPLMKRKFFQKVTQFLVALAVGTLVGDALLHLLPHALTDEVHGHGGLKEDEHEAGSSRLPIWRGLIALAGIYLFFNAERIIGIVTMKTNLKRKGSGRRVSETESCGSCAPVPIIVGHSSDEMRQMANDAHKMFHEHNHLPCGQSVDMVTTVAQSGAKCKQKECDPTPKSQSQTPPESTSTPDKTRHSKQSAGRKKKASKSKKNDLEGSKSLDSVVKGSLNSAKNKPKKKKRHSDSGSRTRDSSNNALEDSVDEVTKEGDIIEQKDAELIEKDTDLIKKDGEFVKKEEEVIGQGSDIIKADEIAKVDIVEEDDDDFFGHGHSHDVPQSCSSVAYLVMMGDGLHNLTDGLAIGAAFANSFPGGMSTAVAVLCHELPHELGDFAMLLKSGMSVKQAFMCNLLSASLQFIGAVIGVAVGVRAGNAQWLFAFAGGIFLYIGLVDMLPTITKVDRAKPWKQLLLQNSGILMGMSIMLLIAIFEENLEHLFE